MAIFKKISPLEGNPTLGNGTMLEFKGMYFQTEDEDQIEFLRGFKCYVEVDAVEEGLEAAPKAATKASTGTISAANLAKLAAQNK